MKLLLDTHTFIWLLSDSKKLSSHVATLCRDPKNSLYLSVVNSWEIQIKVQKGKLTLPVPRKQLIETSLACGLKMLPIQAHHVDALDGLADHHADPFDRLLIAQAKAEGMTLLSVDAKVQQYQDQVSVIWQG